MKVTTLRDYGEAAASTCLLSTCNNLTYLGFGLMAEVGEVCDKIAKWKRKREAYVANDLLVFSTSEPGEVEAKRLELASELGDILWFVAMLSLHLGIPFEELAQMNVDKLASRKKTGTIITHTDH